METWKLAMLPVVGFLVGYLTNYLAVKMLFYPRKKVWGIQGVLPRRKKALAKNLGKASVHFLPKRIRDLEKLPFVGDKIVGTIAASIEKEVAAIDEKKLEKIILSIISKELSFITWIGGILGLIIGLVQIGVLLI